MDFGAPLTIGEAYLKIIMSSFLGFCEWNTRNRWRDGQVCPDVDKELWRLGPDSSGDEETRKRKKRRGDPKGEVERKGTRESGERESEARLDRRKNEKEKKEKSSEKTRAGRFRKRRGESQSVLFRDADQESKTRMRNNALRTGPRQAVE
ncbi:hypothetical protein TNCV_5119631 [Trichonephila clavipes]|nr:hypothetical protein TNCV_5119631 [Trichonephila clavipes]